MAKAEAKIKQAPQKERKDYDHGEVVLRFSDVNFNFGHNKPILEKVSFPVRERAKITLMGQNGAGKSTIFRLILGEMQPEDGTIHVKKGATIGHAMQVVPREKLNMTIKEFFESAFAHATSLMAGKKVYDIDPRIEEVLEAVNMPLVTSRKVSELSGGQQARLLLAYALIQKPDILLLDEPTNNLDKAGIDHLEKFLIDYEKTCIVISHDAKFLNAFTHGVLYLDYFTHQVEQYVGDYLDVVEEIAARIERERKKNATLMRDIQNRKEQMNFFAQKGGHMRDVARKMREAIEELEEQIVDMRQEDKTIQDFEMPAQIFSEPVVKITSVSAFKNGKPVSKKASIVLKKGAKLLITGPNGVGKSTFIRNVAQGKATPTPAGSGLRPRGASVGEGVTLVEGLKIGYYQQDFAGLDFEKTVYKTLSDSMDNGTEQQLRSMAARFLITEELMTVKVGALSEGQKGLLSFATFALMKPGLLILDEPTNHINFRHLPVIAAALNGYQGALILVSHMHTFVEQIKITDILDLGSL
ncbi:MAG: ABC-F family ATP-binding cassette domain-containing protein [bacterium]|nr:ABC-F family ATP-binding cassette domain-containing protein [bacterium]